MPFAFKSHKVVIEMTVSRADGSADWQKTLYIYRATAIEHTKVILHPLHVVHVPWDSHSPEGHVVDLSSSTRCAKKLPIPPVLSYCLGFV